jgi:hypothetical protein
MFPLMQGRQLDGLERRGTARSRCILTLQWSCATQTSGGSSSPNRQWQPPNGASVLPDRRPSRPIAGTVPRLRPTRRLRGDLRRCGRARHTSRRANAYRLGAVGRLGRVRQLRPRLVLLLAPDFPHSRGRECKSAASRPFEPPGVRRCPGRRVHRVGRGDARGWEQLRLGRGGRAARVLRIAGPGAVEIATYPKRPGTGDQNVRRAGRCGPRRLRGPDGGSRHLPPHRRR